MLFDLLNILSWLRDMSVNVWSRILHTSLSDSWFYDILRVKGTFLEHFKKYPPWFVLVFKVFQPSFLCTQTVCMYQSCISVSIHPSIETYICMSVWLYIYIHLTVSVFPVICVTKYTDLFGRIFRRLATECRCLVVQNRAWTVYLHLYLTGWWRAWCWSRGSCPCGSATRRRRPWWCR